MKSASTEVFRKIEMLPHSSAPSFEADRAPRMFRSINSTSALSLGIWVSVPESGRREGLGNQGGGTNSIYPMEQWQLEVWAHA